MSGTQDGDIFAVGNKTEAENEALYVILSIANVVHHGILPFSFCPALGQVPYSDHPGRVAHAAGIKGLK